MAIWQQPAHTLYHMYYHIHYTSYHLLAAQQEPYKKASLLTKQNKAKY